MNDVFQLEWHLVIQAHDWNGYRVQNGFEDDSRAFSAERRRSRRHLVQHRPEGKQVGSAVQFLGADLFRRHVADRAQRRARTGQVLFIHHECLSDCRSHLAGRTSRCRDFRQTEIQNLGASALGHKKVGRLDVTVDDALGVRRIQSIGNFDGER